ncbi:MAG TPA: hypothetical protein PKI93_07165 [Alphaproteobacteria bacterium]|nr:hypothetical protein [Alphaproteobacteria bacterium]HNS44972.1 hypothetical protein [Alphaproteobacteria bacterium]
MDSQDFSRDDRLIGEFLRQHIAEERLFANLRHIHRNSDDSPNERLKSQTCGLAKVFFEHGKLASGFRVLVLGGHDLEQDDVFKSLGYENRFEGMQALSAHGPAYDEAIIATIVFDVEKSELPKAVPA